MPAYGVAQAGGFSTMTINSQGTPEYAPIPGRNLRTISPGDKYTLFDAEAVITGSASVAFARGPSPSMDDAGMTFSVDWAETPTGSTIEIQAANDDAEASYQTIFSSTAVQHENYTDTTRWAFYRAKVTTYSAGGVVTVKVQR